MGHYQTILILSYFSTKLNDCSVFLFFIIGVLKIENCHEWNTVIIIIIINYCGEFAFEIIKCAIWTLLCDLKPIYPGWE